eukprot:Phypoly_transcript_00658.p1 GENE.Phypoly_transcript_00658~~Phypoly_transcript_00658.p1  ORF type:complete len:1364 (+),score=481.35 Phypoly_transcript_00658:143-4234(+)
MTERRHSMMNLGHHNAQRQKVKIEFTICIKQVLGLPKSTTGNLFISWKRGSKKENSGESKHAAIKDQTAVFDFTLPLICTLYQDPKKGFEEKSVVFTLKEETKGGKKANTLGKLAIDLAEFANSKTERIRTFTIKEKKTPVANITLSFKTTWLKMDGKTLIKADHPDAAGKEKVSIDGNDYYLHTEDELSIDETDHKSGNDSDEDGTDFEDDSEKEGKDKDRSSKRKSTTPGEPVANITNVSTLLSAKAPPSPVTPHAAATLSPSTPTPAPTIQITSPGSETKDNEDPKVKKYKKKLKHSRKEVDDLKAELAKKDELLKSTPKSDPAAADTAAQLAALLETEARLRKEIDEANNKVAEVQKNGDAVKAQSDARIKQLEEDLHAREAKLGELERSLSESTSKSDQGSQEFAGKVREYEAKIAELEAQKRSGEEAARAAEAKLSEVERSLSESASRSDQGSQEFAGKVRDFEVKIAELESQRKSAEDAAKAAEARVQELEAAGEVAKANEKKIQDLEATLSEERKKIEEFRIRQAQEEENSRAASKINVEMTRVLENLESKIAEYQRSTENKDAQEKTDSMKYLEEIQRLENDYNEIETENEQLQDSIKELEERHSKAEGDLSAKIAQLETQLVETAARAEKAEARATDLQKNLETDSENAKRLEEENGKLQKRAADLEAQLAVEAGKAQLVQELQEKNEELSEQLSKLQDTNKKEIAKLTAQVAELEEATKELEAIKSQAELAERQKKQLEQEMEGLHEKINTLEAQVQAGAGQEEELVAELQSKNKKAEKEISSLRSQLEEFEVAKASQERELEKALAEKDEAKQSAENAASQITELEEDVAKYKKKAKKAEAQALEMEKQLDELRQQQNGNADEAEKYKELEEKYRAAQDRIEELDDETDRLRKREIVLGELNETTEKRIEELEAELKEAKSRSAAENTQDEQLQKDLEQALAEVTQLKARVRELEEAKSQAAAVPSAGAASAEDVARLQRDVEEYKKVEKAIYWDEIGFTAADISKTATGVWQLLAATRELDAEPRTQDATYPLTPLAHKVITALDKSYRRTQKDDKQVAYWLACACSLLHFIHQRDDIPASADPVLQGVQVDRDQFIQGTNHAEAFGRAVQELTLNIYSQLVLNLQESFQKVIIPAFLQEDLAVMDAQRTPTRGSSHAQLPNGLHSPTSPSSPHNPAPPVPSLTLLTNALTNFLTILRDARCPPVVVKQFFHQILHFISGCVLNALLYGKEVSTATHGLRIKLAVSRIDEWLAKQESDVSGAGERLNLLRDAANVLVLDKSLFIDADTITSIFHTLNLVQVRKLLDLFQPDSVSPANVPQSVKQMMDTYWGYSPHNMPLVVDVTSLVVVN